MKKFYTLIASLFVALSAMAQVTTSNMSGKVTNEGGEALIGATVIAVHTPSGTQYAAVVDGNGVYRLANVRPGGPYTIEFEYIGYRTLKRQDVTLGLGDNYTLNATLVPEGQEIEAIIVTGDGLDSNMRTSNAGAQTTISTRIMESMPTVSRSMNDLMKLTPQAATTSNGFAVGGGNYRQSYVTVDGAAFNNAFGIGGNLPAGGAPISLEALDQMSVNITPFDVRQSGFTGGAINAVTKSGTNEYKVSVYDYYTSDALIGTKYATADGEVKELSLTESLSNTIGFNVGGPIIKNKLFFFVNFEYENNVSPGQSRKAYTGDDEWTIETGNSSQFNRPTVEQMEAIKKHLNDKYGYDPGRYQDYSIQIPNYKVMARLDWNINKDHKFNLRYSLTKNKYSSNPSSSISPMSSSTYDRNTYGRTSQYALYFESSRYYQEQNFTSLAAELNSSFLDGQLHNTLRATYSHQYEPRSFEGDMFPTVDILQTYVDAQGNEQKAVLTSFGPDPFTYGNLRDVNTVVVTDEVTFHKGIHNFVGGLQYEYDNTKNGYMQGGAGFFVYNSWEDFVNEGQPYAFAITHSNRDDLQQVYPSFDFHQISAYVQDEMNISNNFKLTAGIRFELPFYPNIAGNENKAFTEMYKDYGGYKTSDMPAATLNVSPRVGFNWDVLGDRSVVLRGGSGIYTGRLPFVWLVSVAGNSNCMQAQYNTTYGDALPSGFNTNINDILTDIYGGEFKAGELDAPSSATVLAKDLKMPTTWKTSIAADFDLPFGIKGSLEGIYNKDLVSVAVTKTGMQEVEGGVQLPGEPAPRVKYTSISKDLKNAYLITNEGIDKQGYYASLTATLKKDFACGLSLYGAYTYSVSKNVIDGIGDQVTSAFNTNTYGVNGSNSHELGYSSYVAPHRLVLNANYRFEYGKGKFATTVGLFYEGYNYAYFGGYSYTRSSYTLNSNVNGDGGANSLMYIPTEKELESMPFSDDANKAAFNEFIEGDKYLSQNRGEYSERGAVVMPWYNQFNLKINQDFNFMVAGKKQTVQLGLDIKNLGNLINPAWGNIQSWGSNSILTYKDDKYTFNADQAKWSTYAGTISTWSMLLSARYFF